MGVDSYQAALRLAKELSQEEQSRLVEDLCVSAGGNASHQEQATIMELCGLGAEIWEGIDVREYVKRERSSWNG